MQYARPHDCRAKISKDFCAYIFGSHVRTPSQCKKVGIFHKIRTKNPQSEREISEIRYCIFSSPEPKAPWELIV